MDEKHLIFRISEYAITHSFFSFTDLMKALKLGRDETDYVWTKLTTQYNQAPQVNHILNFVKIHNQNKNYNEQYDWIYTLHTSALYNYIDYLEIKEARENATAANKHSLKAIKLSWIAIIISSVIGMIQIILQLFF